MVIHNRKMIVFDIQVRTGGHMYPNIENVAKEIKIALENVLSNLVSNIPVF